MRVRPYRRHREMHDDYGRMVGDGMGVHCTWYTEEHGCHRKRRMPHRLSLIWSLSSWSTLRSHLSRTHRIVVAEYTTTSSSSLYANHPHRMSTRLQCQSKNGASKLGAAALRVDRTASLHPVTLPTPPLPLPPLDRPAHVSPRVTNESHSEF